MQLPLKAALACIETKMEAAITATHEKYSAVRVLRRDLKTMGVTSRFASQFDHERCIPVKQREGAAGTPLKRKSFTCRRGL